jgi:hypothetical protein
MCVKVQILDEYIFEQFEAFTAVTMKNVLFWDVALCTSGDNRRFGGTSVDVRFTQRHIPEDDILQIQL